MPWFTNAGLIEKRRLTFGSQTPAAVTLFPPGLNLPGLLVCLSGYDGTLALTAVTPSGVSARVGNFLDELLACLPESNE
jgi:hypothetical protein